MPHAGPLASANELVMKPGEDSKQRSRHPASVMHSDEDTGEQRSVASQLIPGSEGGSQLIRNLNNYSILPSEEIRRKIDYFISPYNALMNTSKYMKFNELDEKKIQLRPTYLNTSEQLEDPIERHQKSRNAAWLRTIDRIFETDSEVLKELRRGVQL